MQLRPITQKPKKPRCLGWLIILLLILGFVVSVVLYGKGWISEIIQP